MACVHTYYSNVSKNAWELWFCFHSDSLIIGHMDKSPDSQSLESSEMCFLWVISEKISEFTKIKIFFSWNINEANHGLGTKKKEGASESQFFLGYIRNSEVAGVLDCCGKYDLSCVTDLGY